MHKTLLVLLAIVFVLGCTGEKLAHGVEEENATPIALSMNAAVPEHEIQLNISYPLLYDNPVWNHMPIKVYIDSESSQNISWFSENVMEYTRKGIAEWENATGGLVSFEVVEYPGDADITIYWNKNMGESDGGVTIGEARPTYVVDTGYYSVIEAGGIVQTPYTTSCVNKVIATHEIGHMLGLDHNDNGKSIMYPYAWCYQTITPDIIEALEKLYSVPADENIDMAIINASGVKHGSYADAEVYFTNLGATESFATELYVLVNNKTVGMFDVNRLPPGVMGMAEVKNVFIGNSSSMQLGLNINKDFGELFYDNNIVTLS